jgi:hypothetical protein
MGPNQNLKNAEGANGTVVGTPIPQSMLRTLSRSSCKSWTSNQSKYAVKFHGVPEAIGYKKAVE